VTTRGPEHHDLLLEALIKPVAVQASNLELWSAVMPVLAVALVAIAVLLFPLAYRLARKVREAQGERVLLLQRAIDASDLERLRITSDLHDGLVQEFAGLAMSLSATAETVSERDPQTGDALNEASDMVRQGMRSLRSAVMAIYPPTLHSAGLPAALSDLAAPLEAQGIRVRLDVDESLDLPATIEPLLFRCAQESVRNIINHARASEVSISLSASRRSIVLQIVDDGSGFSAAERELAHADGHAGLRLMEDLAKDAGASLVVASEPGRGTTVRLEAPR
jgi:signal transduction histidine kinase